MMMNVVNKKLMSRAGLILLVIVFLIFTLLNHMIFDGARLDLTEGGLYSLSEGSIEIIESIDEPINLYFYFSDQTSENLTSLRGYAKRVEELLGEYESLSDGKINFQVIDPEPFSEAEDQASEFGLQSVPVSAGGDALYFGLVGTNSIDSQEVITFFQPDKESFLEYDISKLIYALVNTRKPKVGLMSSMKIEGDMDMTTFQSTPAWIIAEQMQQMFEVETIELTDSSLPAELDLLVLVHPKNLSEEMLYAIDQFVMKGGRLALFVDPLAEMDRPAQANPMMPSPPGQQSSDLNRLTSAWGVTLRENMVLGDAQTALMVGAGANGSPVRHLAILGMGVDSFSESDVVTAALNTINLATAGILDIKEDTDAVITALIHSSASAMPLDVAQFQFLADPSELQKGFVPTGEEFIVAARISGKLESAFADAHTGKDGQKEGAHIASTENANLLVVADTDILSDRLWVQVQEFFGQRIASPWANNGDFVINALDNLLGSSSLISIRSRGKFTRPFDVVQDLRREAEARYLEKANDLQARLAEAEQELSELESNKVKNNMLMLTPEQEQAIDQFQKQKLKIRKQLREVSHQLNKDIENLGAALKFINIALIPILLTILLLCLHRFLKQRKLRTMNNPGDASE